MRRLAIIGSLSLIGVLPVAACNGQPTHSPQSNDAVSAVPGAGVQTAAAGQGAIATSAPRDAVSAGQISVADIPQVPTEVQVISESGTFVLRTNADDKPLYTYDRDAPDKSNCDDNCAKAWPPLIAPANAKPVGRWTLAARTDGSHQWAFDGKPVYSFAKDAEATASGDGTGGVWHLLPAIVVKK